jgi:hypothetical protein
MRCLSSAEGNESESERELSTLQWTQKHIGVKFTKAVGMTTIINRFVMIYRNIL